MYIRMISSKMKRLIQFCALICTVSGHSEMRVVDLTHSLSYNTPYWPGDPGYNFTILWRGRDDHAGYWYESNYFGTAEHAGTHVDAPAHFYQGAWRSQQIPMEKLIGPGVVINVKAKTAQNPDYRVTVSDLQDWERKYNTRIPSGAVVLMNSGWSSKYPNKTLVFGTDTPSDPSTFHFPGFHEDAADWLATNRNVHVVGVDTPSVDYGQSADFKVHVTLGRAYISGAENVANLDQLPEIGTMVYVGLVKLFDGSGGPARIFATFYDQSEDTTNAARGLSALFWHALVYLLSVFLCISS